MMDENWTITQLATLSPAVFMAGAFGVIFLLWIMIFVYTRNRTLATFLMAPFYVANCFWVLGRGEWWELLPLLPIFAGLIYLVYKLLFATDGKKV